MMTIPDAERPPDGPPPWWKGARGEWYVALQTVLIGVVWLAPRNPAGAAPWPLPQPFWKGMGGLLMFVGALLLVRGLLSFGRQITPLPYPSAEGALIQSGPYRWVRHPIYAGLMACAFGWACWEQGTFTILYAAVLAVFFDLKSRREERWLMEKFPDYAAYRQRVKKFVPYVY